MTVRQASSSRRAISCVSTSHCFQSSQGSSSGSCPTSDSSVWERPLAAIQSSLAATSASAFAAAPAGGTARCATTSCASAESAGEEPSTLSLSSSRAARLAEVSRQMVALRPASVSIPILAMPKTGALLFCRLAPEPVRLLSEDAAPVSPVLSCVMSRVTPWLAGAVAVPEAAVPLLSPSAVVDASAAVSASVAGCVGSLVAGTSSTGSSVTDLTASSIDVIEPAEPDEPVSAAS